MNIKKTENEINKVLDEFNFFYVMIIMLSLKLNKTAVYDRDCYELSGVDLTVFKKYYMNLLKKHNLRFISSDCVECVKKLSYDYVYNVLNEIVEGK